MNASSRPLPTWLKWLMRILGVLLILAALAGLAVTGLLGWAVIKADPKYFSALDQKKQLFLAGYLGRLVGETLVLLFGVWLIRRAGRGTTVAEVEASDAVPVTSNRPVVKSGSGNYQYANVLQFNAERRHVWQFASSGGGFALQEELDGETIGKLPSHIAGKGWRGLLQKKLNIAWLPADKVFLRAIQVPVADFEETLSMIELQLEKLSPLPVAQIVWTIEVIPHQTGSSLQTVLVMIVSRSLVEEYLGRLEEQGYLADRLELPILDQLLATTFNEDGVWIYPGAQPADACLVAWWYGGVLQNVTLLSGVGTPEQAAHFKEQLSQIAWSGELEGWMVAEPKWHLVADAATAQQWEPVLGEWATEGVQIVSPVGVQRLAALSASRAARSRATSLLPAEYGARYQQQNVDRLWMRGLFGVFILYLIGLVIYGSAVLVLNVQVSKVQNQLSSITGSYSNVVQMKERVGLLQEQAALKYAALDSWKAASDLLPEGLTLTSFTFSRGKTIQLFGTVLQDQQRKLTDYNEALQSFIINGKPLEVEPPNTRIPRPDRNGQMVIDWSFICRIPGGETK